MNIMSLLHLMELKGPTLDNKIVPTTWREIGIGIAGRFPDLSIRYQAYIMNGPISYNGLY